MARHVFIVLWSRPLDVTVVHSTALTVWLAGESALIASFMTCVCQCFDRRGFAGPGGTAPPCSIFRLSHQLTLQGTSHANQDPEPAPPPPPSSPRPPHSGLFPSLISQDIPLPQPCSNDPNQPVSGLLADPEASPCGPVCPCLLGTGVTVRLRKAHCLLSCWPHYTCTVTQLHIGTESNCLVPCEGRQEDLLAVVGDLPHQMALPPLDDTFPTSTGGLGALPLVGHPACSAVCTDLCLPPTSRLPGRHLGVGGGVSPS